MIEWGNSLRGGELVLDQLTGRIHIGESSWGESESVIWTKECANESLGLGLVDFASSVIVVLLPEVVEVGSDVLVDLVLLHNVELSDDISGTVGRMILAASRYRFLRRVGSSPQLCISRRHRT